MPKHRLRASAFSFVVPKKTGISSNCSHNINMNPKVRKTPTKGSGLSAPLCSTRDFPDKAIAEIQGVEAIQTADMHKPTNGTDRLDVRRIGFAEVRIASFHISSFAWRNAYADVCHKWTLFLSYCLSHQVDFIMGGRTLLAQ